MKQSLSALLLGACLLCATGCGKPQVDPTFNDVAIAVDETFRPIIEEEMKVFQATHPEAELAAQYVPETDAINMLLLDAVRLIMATRQMSEQEQAAINKTYKLRVKQQQVATDAIALIISPDNPDSLITESEVRRILTGEITRWEQLSVHQSSGPIEIVFDNGNSSTVRYAQETICQGKPLGGSIKEAHNCQGVKDIVAQSPHALGIIGVDWLRNPKDSTNLSFDPAVRVMSVSKSAIPEPNNSYQPVQYYIATGDYAFTRPIYMITTDPRTRSMSRYFYFYVSDTDGQLIITKSSQLLPHADVIARPVNVFN